MVQFFGGIEPKLLLAGYAVMLLALLGVASLSTLVSVFVKKTRDALFLTFLLVGSFHFAAGASLSVLRETTWANTPAQFLGYSICFCDAVEVVNWGTSFGGSYKSS